MRALRNKILISFPIAFQMYRIILVVAFGIASVSFANGIPQNLNQKRDFNDGKQVDRDDNVDSRYYSGKHKYHLLYLNHSVIHYNLRTIFY